MSMNNENGIGLYIFVKMQVFTALQLCSRCICLSACPSVRPSVKRVNCGKTKETSAHIFTPHMKGRCFATQRLVRGERPLLPEILRQMDQPP